LLIDTKRKYAGECTGDTILNMMTDTSRKKSVQSLITNGFEPVQCEDRGFGIHITFYKLKPSGASEETRRMESIAKEFVTFDGTWESDKCAKQQHLALTFASGVLTRTYKRYAAEDCTGEPIAEVTSVGPYAVAANDGLFDYEPESYVVKTTSEAGKTWLTDALTAGCTTGLVLNSELTIKRENAGGTAGCIDDEFLDGIVVENSSKDKAGFRQPEFEDANASTSAKRNNALYDIDVYKSFE
jgi:hypothetical protein